MSNDAPRPLRWDRLADGLMLWCCGFYVGMHIGLGPDPDYAPTVGPAQYADLLRAAVILYPLIYGAVHIYRWANKMLDRRLGGGS